VDDSVVVESSLPLHAANSPTMPIEAMRCFMLRPLAVSE
jgi:hypothetical protein